MRPPQSSRRDEFLFPTAQKVVDRTMASLPPELKEGLAGIPVVLETVPSPLLVEDGIDPDLLGLFCGGDYVAEEGGYDPIPAQILLFLKNIWDYSGRDPGVFREEVRRTLLHEIGHYLGLDEDDLAARDLD